MANHFNLPDLGEGLHEAEISELLVKEGDQIKEGDPLMVVETDKASVEIPSPHTGVVSQIHVKAGDVVEVGTVLVTFDGDGASKDEGIQVKAEEKEEPVKEKSAEEVEKEQAAADEPPKPMKDEQATASEAPKPKKEEQSKTAEVSAQKTDNGVPVAASPTTRRLARELKVDIQMVQGSGPGGRITDEDVRKFTEKGATVSVTHEAVEAEQEMTVPKAEEKQTRRPVESVPGLPPLVSPEDLILPDFSVWGEVERIPLRSIRRAVARKMAVSWSQIPHVSHSDVADITELEQLRQRLKGEVEGGLTLTVIIIKALVAALKQHPRFNATLDTTNGEIILKRFYNIGIAVDTERGLIVPVVRDADRKNMTELAKEMNGLVTRTRDDKNTLEDIQRGTFTITNAGVLGGTDFNPIINHPQVAILGLARAAWTPVVQKNEFGRMDIVPRYILPMVLTFDHRVVDGGDGARFMNTIIEVLQEPEKLLLKL